MLAGWLTQVWGEDRAALLEHAVSAGHGVEVADFALPWVLDNRAEQARLLRWHRRHLAGVAGPVSLHAPFIDIVPASPDRQVRAVASRRLTRTLGLCQDLGARFLVAHTGLNPLIRQPGFLDGWLKRQAAFWSEIVPGTGVQVLFENMWEPDPAPLLALADRTGHLGTALCLDTGHAHLHSTLPVASWVAALGPHLAYLHLNDNHQAHDEELAPGQGTIDWRAVAAALRALPQPPLAVAEVKGSVAGVQQTIAAMSRL